jgi:23S rRNA pseudouridine1911/1915/1917 synthase
MAALDVLYEDNHIIVVKKPCNVAVQRDASGDEDLLSLVKDYVRTKYNKPGEAYIGLVHRLDRPVGGVMVFARTSKAASRLSEQARKGMLEKKYLAIVCGRAMLDASLYCYLKKDDKTNTTQVVNAGTLGAKAAKLDYTKLAETDGLSLLLVSLHTGRSHQIRVQLSDAGLPIWGDQRYNKNAKPGEQIALWSYRLGFIHPTLKKHMHFSALPRTVGAWARFAEQINSLEDNDAPR